MTLKRNISAFPLVYDWAHEAVWPGQIADIPDDIAAGLSTADWGDVEFAGEDATQIAKTVTPVAPVTPEVEQEPVAKEVAPETVPASPADEAQGGLANG